MSGPGVAMMNRALPPLPGMEPPKVSVDFLMPTGIIITMQCSPLATLSELKELLYTEAKTYPLFSSLRDQGFYNFLGMGVEPTRDIHRIKAWGWGFIMDDHV